MSKHTSKSKDLGKSEAKSKASTFSQAVKSIVSTKRDKDFKEMRLSDKLEIVGHKLERALLGKYFRPVAKFFAPAETRKFETIGKVVKAIIDRDDSFIYRHKVSRDIDLSRPDWWKTLAGNILTSKSNKGGNKDAKE